MKTELSLFQRQQKLVKLMNQNDALRITGIIREDSGSCKEKQLSIKYLWGVNQVPCVLVADDGIDGFQCYYASEDSDDDPYFLADVDSEVDLL
jgi:hypothetical protein